MSKYARAKQVVCPDCEAGIGKPCKDLREPLIGASRWGDYSPPKRIKRPHKERVRLSEEGE